MRNIGFSQSLKKKSLLWLGCPLKKCFSWVIFVSGCHSWNINILWAIDLRAPYLSFIWYVLERMVTWHYKLVNVCKIVVYRFYFILPYSWQRFAISWLNLCIITSFSVFSTENGNCYGRVWAIVKNFWISFKYIWKKLPKFQISLYLIEILVTEEIFSFWSITVLSIPKLFRNDFR